MAIGKTTKPFAQKRVNVRVYLVWVRRKIKKIQSGLYLVRAAAASSVVVNNPGEPQVINDHPDLLLSSWTQYLLVTTFDVAAFFKF